MNPRSVTAPAAWLVLALVACIGGTGQAARAQTPARLFPETQHSLGGLFQQYWDTHGGLAQQGYPLTELFTEQSALDGKTYTVQYFERAVFENHPENAGTPYEVLLAQLGTYELKARYPNGAPAGTPNPVNARSFPETGHTIGGTFRAYWDTHGGLAQQGFPLTEEFPEQNKLDGKTYTVQYFERAIFELHPENAGTPYEVLLTQLGKFGLDSRYPNNSNPAAAPITALPGTTVTPAASPTPPVPPTTAVPPTAVPPTVAVPPTAEPPTAVPTPTAVGTNCEAVAPERQSVIGHSGPMEIHNVQAVGQEYVEIRNAGTDAVDLGHWTLRDKNESNQHYSFPAGTTLAGLDTLQVYTEPGHPYSFNSNRAIWNNCGDALELLDAGGTVVATYAYGTHCLTPTCQ